MEVKFRRKKLFPCCVLGEGHAVTVSGNVERGLLYAGRFTDLDSVSFRGGRKAGFNRNKTHQHQTKATKQAITPSFGNENNRGTEQLNTFAHQALSPVHSSQSPLHAYN